MKNKLIYIVEDDKDIRDNLTELLEAEGYSVAVAENGRVALDCLQQGNLTPGLILLDLMMPVMDGPTFLSLIKDPPLSAIPIVVISAGTNKIEGKMAGFMKKPLDLDEVLTAADKFCGPNNH